MILYVIDSSALWRLLRDQDLRASWADVIADGLVGSCHPQRAEFRRSARNFDEYDEMSHMFDTLYPDVPVPKTSWSWIEAAQFRLLRHGAHRALSIADLCISATAAHHGLTVLHNDKDFATAAGLLTDVTERRIYNTP